MESLQELAFIVNKHKLRSLELVGNFEQNQTKLATFYNGLLDNQFSTDDEAAQFFYNTDRKNTNYQKLKSNLKRRLINSLFFIDVKRPNYADRERAFYECYREWAATKILLGKSARKSGIALSHKILREAKKYEFNELVLDISRTLRLHYGYRLGDVKNFNRYHDLYKQYEIIYLEENRAEELYTRLVIEFVNDKSQKKEIFQTAIEYKNSLKDAIGKYPTYRSKLYYSLIQLLAYSCINDHQNTIQVCDESIEFFEKRIYKAKVPLQIYYFQKLICYTQLKQFEKGKEAAEKSLQQLEEGYFNWFKHHESYFLLCMHTREYEEAYSILIRVVQHKRFKFLPLNAQEIWKIFDAYMYYLISIEKLNQSVLGARKKKFNLSKFLNDTPIFTKDKRGLNIPILIAQILFLIRQRKYDQVIDRIEAIERYCSRYLRKDDTFRSNCFIKMLLVVPASGFNRKAVERKSDRYFKKLLENPLEYSNQSPEIEILPYEDLWNYVLDALDNKFHYQ